MNILNKLKLLVTYLKDHKKLNKYIKGNKKQLFLIIILETVTYSIAILLAILSKNVIDFVLSSNMKFFGYSVALYGFITFLLLGLNSYLQYYKTRFSLKLTNSVQENFFGSYFTQDWFKMHQYHSGDIVTRITNDISSIISYFVVILPAIIALIIQLIIAFIVAISYDKTLGIFGFATLPIIIVISLIFGEKLKIQQKSINNKEGEYRSFLNESIQNVLVIKTFQNENTKLKRLLSLQSEKYKLVIKKTKISVYSATVIQIGYTLTSVIAFTWGTYRISQGIITFGMFTAIMQLISRMQTPIVQLSRLLPQYISSIAALERCEPFENYDKTELRNYMKNSNVLGLKIINVSFSYNDNIDVISDLSINIKPGEKIAIIGKSGVGKTTLLKMIMNLYQPKSGTITPYTTLEIECSNSLDYYSYIPQGNTLFSGSIKSNLLIGNSNASDAEIEQALEHACALDFVLKLPLKTNTILGEQGHGLSEGQLQRICIARSLLRDTPILLLDEATSSLDQYTEEKVIQNIYQNYPHKTMIAITHRPSILNFVDKIVELEDTKE